MSIIKDQIKAARFPEMTLSVCLRGDLIADLEQTEAALEALTDPKDDRLNSPTRAERVRLEKVAKTLRERMTAESVAFRVRGLPRAEWRELAAAHPPKAGEQADEKNGFHAQTFWPAVVRRCTIEPDLDEDDYQALLGDETTPGKLTSNQFGRWADACWAVNERGVDVPFSQTALAAVATTANGSKPPSD
jgi:hypothetical protein